MAPDGGASSVTSRRPLAYRTLRLCAPSPPPGAPWPQSQQPPLLPPTRVVSWGKGPLEGGGDEGGCVVTIGGVPCLVQPLAPGGMPASNVGEGGGGMGMGAGLGMGLGMGVGMGMSLTQQLQQINSVQHNWQLQEINSTLQVQHMALQQQHQQQQHHQHLLMQQYEQYQHQQQQYKQQQQWLQQMQGERRTAEHPKGTPCSNRRHTPLLSTHPLLPQACTVTPQTAFQPTVCRHLETGAIRSCNSRRGCPQGTQAVRRWRCLLASLAPRTYSRGDRCHHPVGPGAPGPLRRALSDKNPTVASALPLLGRAPGAPVAPLRPGHTRAGLGPCHCLYLYLCFRSGIR